MNPCDGPLVICSVLESTPARASARIAAAPDGCALVELRADRLQGREVGPLVRSAGRDLIVTVRRPEDGGTFDGSEDERRAILEVALAAGARFVDVELDGALADLADGEFASRVILSHHGAACYAETLRPLAERLNASGAARTKLVPHAASLDDVDAIRTILDEYGHGRRLACFAMGRAGAVSRLVAPHWGSWATYGSGASVRPTAPGQFTAADLIDVYDVLHVGPDTRWFALLGTRVFRSPSPAMHAAAYRATEIDARYVPLEFDDLAASFDWLTAGCIRFSGFAVTMPFKGPAAERCTTLDDVASGADAVNTVTVEDRTWRGANTDGPAARRCIELRLGDGLTGRSVAILGAGGTARAVAVALTGAGASVTFVVRDVRAAREAGSKLDADFADWSTWDGGDWDVLVNATPLGSAGEAALPAARLTGSVVLDAVYGPVPTPLIDSAGAAGLATVSGYELLVAQAVLQFERLTGARADEKVMAKAGREWLAARG